MTLGMRVSEVFQGLWVAALTNLEIAITTNKTLIKKQKPDTLKLYRVS